MTFCGYEVYNGPECRKSTFVLSLPMGIASQSGFRLHLSLFPKFTLFLLYFHLGWTAQFEILVMSKYRWISESFNASFVSESGEWHALRAYKDKIKLYKRCPMGQHKWEQSRRFRTADTRDLMLNKFNGSLAVLWNCSICPQNQNLTLSCST
jgi:hypothetical protein